ncbi:type II secretion system F family protein [Thiobacter aerophilum]|uniref:Type II secretion system F family protein n=1 Tax=Thiobacter aerophilum TaxID=3121275 RepID=A0ABV0EDD8_9BURK
MPAFQYSAVDRDGRRLRGRMDAANEADLEQRLKRMGLDLITCRVQTDAAPLFGRPVSRRDLINFCFQLEQITRSGIPLLDGVADLAATLDNPRFREVVAAVHEDMVGGRMLSDALANHPTVFDALFVSLIRAGEQTGNLPEVLANLAATLKWRDELAAQTKRLLIYPTAVLIVVGAVIVFLMLYLVPELTTFLRTMRQELPWQTRALIAISDFVGRYWLLLFLLLVTSLGLLLLASKRGGNARLTWDYLKLNLPLIGPILQKILLARFANFFALLYGSGITVLDALAACEGIVANRYVADGLRRAAQQIAGGESITESFRNTGLFPPLVLRMIRVGETTGALDAALMNVTYFYNRDVRESVERALKLLEPALTVLLGLILAAILFAVLAPVYDILGTVKL